MHAPLSPTTKWAFLAVGSVTFLCILIALSRDPSRPVILDSRFRVFRTVVSKGPTYTVYSATPREVQVREWLSKCGLPVSRVPSSLVGIRPGCFACFVYFSLSAFPGEVSPDAFEAELVSSNGAVLPLSWFTAGGSPFPRYCWSGWLVDSAAVQDKAWGVLRLSLRTNHSAVAEMRIRKW